MRSPFAVAPAISEEEDSKEQLSLKIDRKRSSSIMQQPGKSDLLKKDCQVKRSQKTSFHANQSAGYGPPYEVSVAKDHDEVSEMDEFVNCTNDVI